jgi:hypothetical protein
VVLEVGEDEAADGRWPLGVEQDEQPGDAIFGFDGVVVQQPAGLVPACFGVDDARRAVPFDGQIVQVAMKSDTGASGCRARKSPMSDV